MEEQLERILEKQFKENYDELIQPEKKTNWLLIIIIIIIIIIGIIIYKNNKNKDKEEKNT